MMMTEMLAQTAQGADPMISGDWVLKLVGAVFTGAALILGRYWGKKEASSTRLEDPMPEVPTRKVSTPPSWDAHKALMDRVMRQEQISNELRHDLSEVRKEMTENYKDLMAAGQARETSISDKLDGIARGIHSRIDDLMKSKPAR